MLPHVCIWLACPWPRRHAAALGLGPVSSFDSVDATTRACTACPLPGGHVCSWCAGAEGWLHGPAFQSADTAPTKNSMGNTYSHRAGKPRQSNNHKLHQHQMGVHTTNLMNLRLKSWPSRPDDTPTHQTTLSKSSSPIVTWCSLIARKIKVKVAHSHCPIARTSVATWRNLCIGDEETGPPRSKRFKARSRLASTTQEASPLATCRVSSDGVITQAP